MYMTKINQAERKCMIPELHGRHYVSEPNDLDLRF